MIELLEKLEYIEDPRQKKKIKHKLSDVVGIVLFATLGNANEWEEIADFAELHEELLRKYFELSNGIPSHDTIQRVMGLISPEVIQGLVNEWNELASKEEGEKLKKILNIDGKTMRGNGNKNKKPNHIVSAWSKEDGFCLGQVKVEEKKNEIAAIPELLNKINIKNHIVTIDAMGTQKKIVEQIKNQKGDYVLAVKGNQGTLHQDLIDYFAEEEFLKGIINQGGYKKTVEKAHNQIEIREYYQTSDIKWLTNKEKWVGLKSIGIVRTTTKKEDKESIEIRYYISSLKTEIELFAKAARGHWAIESMHWHLDVTFKEDANTTLDKVCAQNLNILRKWSLTILELLDVGKKNVSLKRKRFRICSKPDLLIEQILNI